MMKAVRLATSMLVGRCVQRVARSVVEWGPTSQASEFKLVSRSDQRPLSTVAPKPEPEPEVDHATFVTLPARD